ncbi:hypothetical protein M3Y94_01063900 [Aphelenchoides besseyi]|nr:hypothetical protein M3Y94_01063900 [Aphelenchoides besseyi]
MTLQLSTVVLVSLIISIVFKSARCHATDELMMWEYVGDDIGLYQPHQKLLDDMQCTVCKKTLELAAKWYPNAVNMGKGPLKAAIPAACIAFSVVSPVKFPMMNKVCEWTAGKTLDKLVDLIANGSNGMDPENNCKKIGMCGKKC